MLKHVTRTQRSWLLGLALVTSAALISWLAIRFEPDTFLVPAPTATAQAADQRPVQQDATPIRAEPRNQKLDSPALVTDTTGIMARSAAQPVLTLTAHLAERGNQLPWGEPGKTSRSPNISRDIALSDPRINPTGKQLDREQEFMLAKLLGELDIDYENLWLQMCAARKAVLLRSIDAGRVKSFALDSPGEANDIFSVGNQAQRGPSLQKDAVGELSRRFGTPMKDWGYADMSTTEPDSIRRMNLIYWTRMDEPDFFRLQDACSALQMEHISRVRGFFDGL